MNKLYPEDLEIIEDEIISIEEFEIIDTIDIEIDSKNKLFFANDILTHNSGWETSDLNITNISESAALLHTVDILFGIITNAEMKARGEYLLKCLANRVAGYENTRKRFEIDWKYARITEDKNSPIQDMDFLINNIVNPEGGGPRIGQTSADVHQFISNITTPNVPSQGNNPDINISGLELFPIN